MERVDDVTDSIRFCLLLITLQRQTRQSVSIAVIAGLPGDNIISKTAVDKDRDAKAMGRSVPSSIRCDITALMP